MGEMYFDDVMPSWSATGITADDLYGDKVETIPCNFKSLDHYLISDHVPLIEETRSDLCPCLELIMETPSPNILSMESGSYFMHVDFWDNEAGFSTGAYAARNADIFIFSSMKPEAADHGLTYCLAMVTEASVDDEYQKGFRLKVAKDIGFEIETIPCNLKSLDHYLSYRVPLIEETRSDLSSPLDVLIVDEAAQVRECELVIPLRLHWVKHVVLVGDDCQLSSMVKNKVCKEVGFGTSLYGRLVMLKFGQHLLHIQYRMNPCISLFPNAQFYEKKSLDGPNVLCPSYSKDYTCLPFGTYTFINVSDGRADKKGTGNSRRNMVEVAVVSHLIHTIFKSWKRTGQGLSISVVSPYDAQVDAIKSRLGKKYDTCDGFRVRVKSINGFQGEGVIIIASTVRSDGRPVGFLADNQRTNVALTRARHCLWIVGNAYAMYKSGTKWTNIVTDAERRKCDCSATNDATIYKFVLQVKQELDELGLLNTESLDLNSTKWKPTVELIMGESGKRYVSNANAKSESSAIDEGYGNDFLLSWKVPKSGKDTIDFDVESVPKSISMFTFNMEFRNVKPALVNETVTFSLLTKSANWKPSRPPQVTSEITLNQRNGASKMMKRTDLKREHKHAQPEKLNITSATSYSPELQGLSTTSLNSKHGAELPSAVYSSMLNAPSSTSGSAEPNNATFKVVIEFLNLYFEFPVDGNCMIRSVASLALSSKGIAFVDGYFSCQLEYFSGDEIIKSTTITTGSILHIHLRLKGGTNIRRSGESNCQSNKRLKTIDRLELDMYISLLKSKRCQLWFERVNLSYDLWWGGYASEVQLGPDSRRTFTLLIDSFERVHDTGYCYNGSVPVDHIFYNSKLGVVEIVSCDTTLSAITPLGLFNDYSTIVELVNTYFSYMQCGIRRYPMYVQSLLTEIDQILTKPQLCLNSTSRAALIRPLCNMSSSQRLNMFTSVINCARTNTRLQLALTQILIQWTHDFQTPPPVRVPLEFLARYKFQLPDGTNKNYLDTLFSQTDYGRCLISHSKFSGKELDAALYHKWESLLVNLQSVIIRVLTDNEPAPEKVPLVPVQSAQQVHFSPSSEIDLREIIGLV